MARARDRSPDRRQTAVTGALRERITGGLHLGLFRHGDRLPSLRVVAAEMDTDPRVVLAAYRRLAAEGLVRVRARSGVFVDGGDCPGSWSSGAGNWIVDLCALALSRGVAPTELRQEAWLRLDGPHLKVACVECNHDQLHALCWELHHDYGLDATGLETDDLTSLRPPPAPARDARLLVTTRFHAAEVQRAATRLGKPVLVITLDSTFVRGILAVLAAGPLHYVCTDARFAAKLPHIFAGFPGMVRPVLLGRDCLTAIPAGSNVYAMPRAIEQLPSRELPHGWVCPPRVFSPQTQRALLSFIVKANLAAPTG